MCQFLFWVSEKHHITKKECKAQGLLQLYQSVVLFLEVFILEVCQKAVVTLWLLCLKIVCVVSEAEML